MDIATLAGRRALAVMIMCVMIVLLYVVVVNVTTAKTVLVEHVMNVVAIFARDAKQLAMNATKPCAMIVWIILVNTAGLRCAVRVRVSTTVY